MKLSLNWIKEYVELPYELSKIAYDLTMATVEVEGWEEISKNFDKIVVGVVLELKKHPDADKLTLCKVDIGGEEKEIVCGGTNLREGMKVAVSLPGAKVRWHGVGELVEIKKSKVRGVESFGMICASSEIGLFDLFPFTEEATILDLSAFDAPAGTNVADALCINDTILEIDNKSLTNRPDLWGHYGIARELSALYGLPLKKIELKEINAPEMEITLEDAARSPRYIGVKIEDLAVKPSPFEIQTRLWLVGLRPINAIVDITNYVMLATGQPTHAFDSDKIEGHIIVRRASDGEKLLLLDDRELSLTTEDLVIADEKGSVGLAGVMGGKRDSVLPETNKIILEIANFEPRGIRRTASRYDSRTDAATRYEKGIDPQRADIALSVAMELFAKIYPEMKVTGFKDNYPLPLERKEVLVSLEKLASRLGKRITNEEIRKQLELLGFNVEFFTVKEGEILRAIAPTWRSTGDISIPDDIMEELARIHGYENFEAVPITTTFKNSINQPKIDIDRKIREFLAFRCGMREIFTYPWVKDEFLDVFYPNTDKQKNFLALSAPPAPDEKYLRISLLPNICKAVAANVRYLNEFSVFESALGFLPDNFINEYDSKESLPRQKRQVAGAFVGSSDDIVNLFRRAKGTLEALPRYTHVKNYSFEQKEKPSYADDVVWLNICDNDIIIGNIALLSKKSALNCGIKNQAVMFFELDIDSLEPFASRENKFSHLPNYPVNEYDLSLLFNSSVKWAEISNVITEKNNILLRGVSFVDEYRGKQIPEGKKSVTFRLTIGSDEKTLKSEEIESVASAISKRLVKQLGAETREK